MQDDLGTDRGERSEDDAHHAECQGVEHRRAELDPGSQQGEREADVHHHHGGAHEHQRTHNRDSSVDPPCQQPFETSGLLLAPCHSRDQGEPHERHQERGDEPEFVLDDTPERVDALHVAVDRNQGVTDQSRTVGRDLLGRVVELGHGGRGESKGADRRQHPHQEASALHPPQDGQHGPGASHARTAPVSSSL